jgi:hypothetical protein
MTRRTLLVALTVTAGLALSASVAVASDGFRNGFLSPDHQVWCLPEATMFCGTGGAQSANPNPPQSAAYLFGNGKVELCHAAVPSVATVCFQNWDANSPILAYGQSETSHNTTCSSATTGITCVIASGAGQGRGFTINATSVRRIGPAGPPPPPNGFPVMGCDGRGADTAAHAYAYRPSTCLLSSVGPKAPEFGDQVTLQSIAHVHWSHWGAKRATGRGGLVFCGTGCVTFPATMVVSGLSSRGLAIGNAYSWLTVTYREPATRFTRARTATKRYYVWPTSTPDTAIRHGLASRAAAAISGDATGADL